MNSGRRALRAVAAVGILLCLAGRCPAAEEGAPAEDEPLEAAPEGLSASVVDIYGFRLKLDRLTLLQEVEGEEGVEWLVISLTSEGERVNLRVAAIEQASFAPADGGGVTVTAQLQNTAGENADDEFAHDEIAGHLADADQYVFEGVIAEGARRGNTARIPLGEVKSLVVHTPYAGAAPGAEGDGLAVPMPAADEDVLWVSSTPTGAEVLVRGIGRRAPRRWRKFRSIGVTPVAVELPPGRYEVRVVVPDAVAEELDLTGEPNEDINPFEPDGWKSILVRKGANVVDSMSMVYGVTKEEGLPATVIALYQPKGLSPEDALAELPEGNRYTFTDRKLEGVLLKRRIPKADVAIILQALHRAGKFVWHGERQSLMIELTPGERGWRITRAARPKKKGND